MLSHRVQLHEELKRKALCPEADGIPAVLKTSSIVADVDPDTATVTLEDGSSFSGDVVLGADGVSVMNTLSHHSSRQGADNLAVGHPQNRCRH
jgi:2-polyprenyl-6-methoxyphenol hydroxylase-like FAD-dependent oxidoreductase